jgi:hypothetical protein
LLKIANPANSIIAKEFARNKQNNLISHLSLNFQRSGFIEYVEIMDEEKGLLKFIRDTFLKAEAERPVPDLRKDRDGWYRQPGKTSFLSRC